MASGSPGGMEPAPGRGLVALRGTVVVTHKSLYGNGPPMLFARADETAPRTPATAEKAARMTDRNFMNRRWGMPGSFQGQGADSCVSVCFGGASVNYC